MFIRSVSISSRFPASRSRRGGLSESTAGRGIDLPRDQPMSSSCPGTEVPNQDIACRTHAGKARAVERVEIGALEYGDQLSPHGGSDAIGGLSRQFGGKRHTLDRPTRWRRRGLENPCAGQTAFEILEVRHASEAAVLVGRNVVDARWLDQCLCDIGERGTADRGSGDERPKLPGVFFVARSRCEQHRRSAGARNRKHCRAVAAMRIGQAPKVIKHDARRVGLIDEPLRSGGPSPKESRHRFFKPRGLDANDASRVRRQGHGGGNTTAGAEFRPSRSAHIVAFATIAALGRAPVWVVTEHNEALLMLSTMLSTSLSLFAVSTALCVGGLTPSVACGWPASNVLSCGMIALATPASIAAKDLDFTPSELRLWRDPESGKHFWYMTYDVVNNTGADQRFAPRIELVVDDGRIVRHGEGVSSDITKALKEFLGNELLEDQFEILGTVLQGKEHAKSGLVVFVAEDLEPTELTVMVQGLSRETEKKPHPKTGEMVTLRKNARVDYLVPGDPKPSGTMTYPIVEQGWAFR